MNRILGLHIVRVYALVLGLGVQLPVLGSDPTPVTACERAVSAVPDAPSGALRESTATIEQPRYLLQNGGEVALNGVQPLGTGGERSVYRTDRSGLLIGVTLSEREEHVARQILEPQTSATIALLTRLPTLESPYLRLESLPQAARYPGTSNLFYVSFLEEGLPVDRHNFSIRRENTRAFRTRDLRLIYRLGRELISAARSLASAGFFHPDIKLSNVLYLPGSGSDSGHFVLSDYGVLNQLPSFTGEILRGTPTHMSPEQFNVGASLDLRSMLYSISVTLLEALYREEIFLSMQKRERIGGAEIYSFALNPRATFTRVKSHLEADLAADIEAHPSDRARAVLLRALKLLILTGLEPNPLDRLSLTLHEAHPPLRELHLERLRIRRARFFGENADLVGVPRP